MPKVKKEKLPAINNSLPQYVPKVGHPPIIKSPEEMSQKMDEYFKTGVTIKEIVVGKAPNKEVKRIAIPTISGLAFYLGFESRQSLNDYEKKPEYSAIIKRGRLLIERGYEEMLQTTNVVGAIFALKNMGWIDKQDHMIETPVNPLTIEETKLRIQKLREELKVTEAQEIKEDKQIEPE